jgi:hypothetical protein
VLLRSGPGSQSREERVGQGRQPPQKRRVQVRNEQKEITHLREAAAHHTRYSVHNLNAWRVIELRYARSEGENSEDR